MLLPLGDNVDHDRPPIAGFAVILGCTAVWLHSFRIDFGDPTHAALMQFLQTWGLSGKALSEGRVIGLFTHMWLHVNFFHLLGNMFALCAFMWTLEGVLGSGRFLTLYGVSGLCAGGLHALLEWGSDVPMVGASGAIAGVMGAYFLKFGPSTSIRCVFFFFGRVIPVNIPSVAFAMLWLASQLWGVMTSGPGEGGVAWLAHGVGFGVGSLLMLLLYDESRCRVACDKSGELVIVSESKVKAVEAAKPQHFALDAAAEIPQCSTCGTLLDDKCRIAAGLWKCPNPACVRLNYAASAPVALTRS